MGSSVFFLLAMFSLQAGVSADKIRAFDTDIDIPEECLKEINSKPEDEAIYCSHKPLNYPHEHVDNYLKDLPQRFGFHDVNQMKGTYDEYTDEDNCESEKNKNCCSVSKIDQPFILRSNSKFRLVMQSEKFFNQQLKYTKCRDDEDATTPASCFEDFHFKAWDTKCVTNTTPVKLVVYNDDRKEMESVMIQVPVACSCFAIRKVMTMY